MIYADANPVQAKPMKICYVKGVLEIYGYLKKR